MKKSNLNIIVKGKTPLWRPLQPRLGSFSSLHKDGAEKVEPSMPVEKQFDSLELIRIANACRHTATLNINQNDEDETEESLNDLKRELLKYKDK